MSRISVALNVLPRNVKVNTLPRSCSCSLLPTLLARNGWLRVNLRDCVRFALSRKDVFLFLFLLLFFTFVEVNLVRDFSFFLFYQICTRYNFQSRYN